MNGELTPPYAIAMARAAHRVYKKLDWDALVERQALKKAQG